MAGVKTKRGGELTEREIEALADEAERGYDLDRAARVPVGRPPLGSGGVSPRLNVRIPEEIYEALRRRAHAESRSLSELTREALAQYLGWNANR